MISLLLIVNALHLIMVGSTQSAPPGIKNCLGGRKKTSHSTHSGWNDLHVKTISTL